MDQTTGLTRETAWQHLCDWTPSPALRRHARAVEEHPKRIVAWLEEHGEAAVAHAVSAHYTQWGVSYDTLLDKALLACDELTGLVMACCYVRPEGVSTLTVKSVMKKIKDKNFAAGVDRKEVQVGVRMLGVALGDHVQFLIDAIRPFAAELGIEGRQV